MDDRATSESLGARLLAGAVAGVGAGLAMAAFAMTLEAAFGLGFFAPLKLAAASVWGPEALGGGAFADGVGLALHLGISMLWGALLGLIPQPDRAGPAAALIALATLVIYAAMTHLALPWFDRTLYERLLHERNLLLAADLLFAAFVVLALRRRDSERASGPRRTARPRVRTT